MPKPIRPVKPSSITLSVPDSQLGLQVYATVNEVVDSMWVKLVGSQNGVPVYAQWGFVYPKTKTAGPFNLGPTPSWSEGAADGYGEVGVLDKFGNLKVLATTTFKIAA